MTADKPKTPNAVLRHLREVQRHESRQEFAASVVKAGRLLGDHTLACDARLVARWEDGDVDRPRPAYQRALAALSGRPFHELGFRQHGDDALAAQNAKTGDDASVALRLTDDSPLSDAVDWLDRRAGWVSGQALQRLNPALHALDLGTLRARGQLRGEISRAEIATAMAAYYEPSYPYRFYVATSDGKPVTTSVLTRPDWLDLSLPLREGRDDIHVDLSLQPPSHQLPDVAIYGAIRRLAEIVRTGTQLVNAPLYRLQRVEVSRSALTGTVGLARFVDYALTLDLLETELMDAILAGHGIATGSLPLRDHYLPDATSLTDIADRFCAGGPLALFAVARSRRRKSRADYALLIQERSANVLNSARRLAVIPKGFHAPMVGFADDAQITSTIERELEEELFGRAEVDSTFAHPLHADPMHISRLTPPMRWLAEHDDSDSWRIECTGFGINAITGTFEVASLIVIDNPSWWGEYGGQIEANWESAGLQRYSSLDHDQLADLIHNPAWSNEGIFAFCQALRRLAQIGGERVNLPSIDLEIVRG